MVLPPFAKPRRFQPSLSTTPANHERFRFQARVVDVGFPA
jgi:hypothetical protein